MIISLWGAFVLFPCNQYLSPLTLWVKTLLRWGVLNTTLCRGFKVGRYPVLLPVWDHVRTKAPHNEIIIESYYIFLYWCWYLRYLKDQGSLLLNQRLSRPCIQEWSLEGPLQIFLFFMPIGNPRWLPPQVIVLTQDHIRKIQKYLLLWSYCTDWP
jgi:hypothetical protein